MTQQYIRIPTAVEAVQLDNTAYITLPNGDIMNYDSGDWLIKIPNTNLCWIVEQEHFDNLYMQFDTWQQGDPVGKVLFELNNQRHAIIKKLVRLLVDFMDGSISEKEVKEFLYIDTNLVMMLDG